MEGEVHGRAVASHSESLTCARMTAVIYGADVGAVGPPGSATEPEESRLPCLWDLALQDESE